MEKMTARESPRASEGWAGGALHQTRQMIMGLLSFTAGGGKRPEFKWKCINMTEQYETNEVEH